MKYLKFWIGDYQRDTAHLTALEEGVYLRLLLAYYATEKPLPEARIAQIARVRSRSERRSLDAVLTQFWSLSEDGYWNQRASLEIEKNKVIRERKQEVGKLGGRPKKAQRFSDGYADGFENETIEKAIHSHNHNKDKDLVSISNNKESNSSYRGGEIFFDGQIVRLNERDFLKWKETYYAIPDLKAELMVVDAYYAQNPPRAGKWFYVVQKWLSKAHQEAIQRQKTERDDETWN